MMLLVKHVNPVSTERQTQLQGLEYSRGSVCTNKEDVKKQISSTNHTTEMY